MNEKNNEKKKDNTQTVSTYSLKDKLAAIFQNIGCNVVALCS